MEGQERIGLVAAELMEALEGAELPDDVEASIGTVGIVIEVDLDAGHGAGSTFIRYRCSDPRVWIQRAFFEEALKAVDGPAPADPDDYRGDSE